MRLITPIQNEQGFTLTDTMIIAGLLILMISAFASYRFQQSKAAKVQNDKNVYSQLQSNMKSGANQTQSISKSEELSFDKIP